MFSNTNPLRNAKLLKSTFFKDDTILINLTATLNSKTVREVMRHLGITKNDTYMVTKSPLNRNTHITIMEKNKGFNLLASLLNFLTELHEDQMSKRMVIFCTSLEDCGKIYRDISHSSFKDELQPITQVRNNVL